MTDTPAPSARGRGRRVIISCGEASGDLYAAALTDALREIDPAIAISGFGGPRLARAGADLIGDYRGMSVTGLVEAASALSKSWRMMRLLGETARASRPDVFVAIDFPDFNLRLLPVMHRMGIPIVYYVSPQLWAWRPARIETIRRYVTRMLVIFPFEQDIYERGGVSVEFVGHPLVDLAVATGQREEWLRRAGLDSSGPVVALLPGSRPNEVQRILPVLSEAIPLILARVPDAQFVVARAPALDDRLFDPVMTHRARGRPAIVVEGATDEALAAADVVVTASGTATVQTALHGRPMVIVYRLSPVTYAIGRRFVRVPTYGMVNLIAGRQIVPELIQDQCTPPRVADETVSLLADAERADRMRNDLAGVRAALGGAGASMRAARAIVRVIDDAGARTSRARDK